MGPELLMPEVIPKSHAPGGNEGRRAFHRSRQWSVPWLLVCAAFLYVLLRGLILFTAFDATALPVYEIYPMGTMAKLVLEGVWPPLSLYYDNAGGQIVTGFIAVPFYAAFG